MKDTIPGPTAAFSHHSLLFIFTFFWGANFILAEIALDDMSPLSFSASRLAMGGIAMLTTMYFQCFLEAKRMGTPFRFFPAIERGDRVRLLLVAITGALLAPWLGIEGLGLTHGARASIWLALGPAISTGCGHFFSSERMGVFGYAGVLFAGFGTVILAYDGLRISEGYWVGDLLLFLALSLTVVELHLIRPLARKYGSISMVTLRTLIGGSLYLLVASPALVGESWLSFGFWTWFAILAGGAIGVGIGQWVKVRALWLIGPTRVVIYGNLVPVTALIIAWFALGQFPTPYELLAACLIIAGAISIQVLDASHRHRPIEPEDDKLSVVASGKAD